jgi:hypothetical protein
MAILTRCFAYHPRKDWFAKTYFAYKEQEDIDQTNSKTRYVSWGKREKG